MSENKEQQQNSPRELNPAIVNIRPSGIRKFFDIVSEMKDAISLGVGEPDFDTPWHIREEGIHSLEKGRTFYSSNAGLLELREAISDYVAEKHQVQYDPKNEVMVTVGGSEAIDLAMRVILEPGDEVLIPEPCYVSYTPCVKMAYGIPVPIALEAKDQFRLTKEKLEQAITEKTKILVLPFPNNPTGAIMEKKDLEEIVPLILKHNLYVLTDEIYSALCYKGEHRNAGKNRIYQRVFQGLCYDRMALGICLQCGSHFKANVKAPSVCHYVCSYHLPVLRYCSYSKRRRGCGQNAGCLQ